MTNQQQERAARDCLCLSHKYYTLRGCVKDQRPELMADPVLLALDAQIDALMAAFDKRVQDLAGNPEEF